MRGYGIRGIWDLGIEGFGDRGTGGPGEQVQFRKYWMVTTTGSGRRSGEAGAGGVKSSRPYSVERRARTPGWTLQSPIKSPTAPWLAAGAVDAETVAVTDTKPTP